MTIQKEYNKFIALLEKHQEYGTYDGEVTRSIKFYMQKALKNEKVNKYNWHIYSLMEGSQNVSNELTTQFKILMAEVKKNHEIKTFFVMLQDNNLTFQYESM